MKPSNPNHSFRLALALALFLAASSGAFATPRPFRVVIDPGHGGQDHGARVGAVTEKDVTLALAKQVADQLRARGISVSLTRNGDEEVSLASRTALANRLKADVFLSIHMNSSVTPGSEGIETYILNSATDATSKRLAHFENVGLSVRGSHDGLVAEANAAEPETDVALILQDLRLDANLSESKRLACSVQDELVSTTSGLAPAAYRPRLRDRGVKQALFYVLLGAKMPSILVEAGFLNSARDRALATSPAGQSRMSAAIARAVDQYRRSKNTSHAQLALSRCQVH